MYVHYVYEEEQYFNFKIILKHTHDKIFDIYTNVQNISFTNFPTICNFAKLIIGLMQFLNEISLRYS